MEEPRSFLREIVRAIGLLPFAARSCLQLGCYLLYFAQPIFIQAALSSTADRDALVALVALALSLLMPAVIDLINNRTMQDFRRHSKDLVFRRLLRKGYPYYLERSSSELQSYLNEVSFACRNLEDRYVHTVLRMVAMGVLYACSLCLQSVVLGLAYALFLAAYLVTSARLSSRGRSGVGDALASTVRVNAAIADSVANVGTVLSLGAQKGEGDRVYGCLEEEASQYRAVQGRTNVSALAQGLMVVCFAAVLLLLAAHWRASMATTLLMLLYSILNLTGFGSQYLLMCEMLDRLDAALRALDLVRVREGSGAVLHDSGAQSLELEGVCYAYPRGEAQQLRDKSVSFEKGAVTALVGPNGSGKSTLLKVVAGLLAPDSGHLLVPYDAPCRTMLIGQGVTLFNRSLAENLFYPEAAGDVDLAMRLVAEIGLDKVVSSRRQLFSLTPGDLSGRVSGGELQKVQILRAILYGPDVLLCDEITSGLDAASVERFYRMLRRHLPDTTVVCVVHREDELKYFDSVVTM